MSFGDKFSKFKTATLQSVGKAEKTSEGEEFAAMITTMKDTKNQLTDLYDGSKKFYKNYQDAMESLEKLAGCTQKAQLPSSTAIPAVSMLSTSATGGKDFCNLFKVHIIDTLDAILTVQYKQADKAWGKVESTRLEMDSATSRYRSALDDKKKTSAECDALKYKADAAEAEYNAAKNTCIEACNALSKAKESFAQEKLPLLANCLGEAGASWCGAATDFIETTK